MLIVLDDHITLRAEHKNIVVSHQLVDLHICTVLGSQGDRTVEHELHIAGAAGFLRCQGDLLGNVTCRDQLFRLCHVVVLNHNDLQIRTDLRILVHDLLQTEDQVNDVLRDHVSRSCFCPEDYCNRGRGLLPCLDLQILVDHIKRVHLLPLVLMETLDLDIKDRVGIQFYPLGVLQVLTEHLFIFIFYLQKA